MNDSKGKVFSLDRLYPTVREEEHYKELKKLYGIRDATEPQSLNNEQPGPDVPEQKATT